MDDAEALLAPRAFARLRNQFADKIENVAAISFDTASVAALWTGSMTLIGPAGLGYAGFLRGAKPRLD